MAQELEHYELTLLAVFCEYQKLTNLVQVKLALGEKIDASFGDISGAHQELSKAYVNSKCFRSRIAAVILFFVYLLTDCSLLIRYFTCK